MAAVAGILGGAVGFMSGLISLILFNASWLFALGMWAMGGIAVTLVLVALFMTPRQDTADNRDTEHA